MNNSIRNILVVILGIAIGGALNMLIVVYSPFIFPLPEGVDPSVEGSLAAGIHLFTPVNFLMTFLAHALGTLLASFIITKFAASHHYKLAMIPGLLFLLGGYMMTQMVDAPFWFDAADLLLAYLPMSWLGYTLAKSKK